MTTNGSLTFHHEQLANGLEVIAELNPHVHSVAAAFAVKAGARDENPKDMGVSHFLEHMAFKGGGGLDSIAINRGFEDLGADINAFTSQETTVYHCQVLPEYLDDAVKLLSGLVRPALRDDDFQSERGVILDEIAESEDQPAYINYDLVMESHFNGHALGHRVLGTTESIERLAVGTMRDYHAARYGAGNVVFAVAGNTTWDCVRKIAESYCAAWNSGTAERTTTPLTPSPQVAIKQREGFQQYVSSLCAGPAAEDPMRYAGQLLCTAVGDDVGSRMFWALIDSGRADMADIALHLRDGYGYYIADLSCRPEHAAENASAMGEILSQATAEGISEEELSLAQVKTKSRLVLRSEQPMGRLLSFGGNWLKFGEYRSPEDDIAAVDAVTPQTIRELLDRFPLLQTTVSAVGPLESLEGFAPVV